MKNPFRLYQDKYILYCKQCWMTGSLGINPEYTTILSEIKDTAYRIHGLTSISKCKARASSIVLVKHTPILKKGKRP